MPSTPPISLAAKGAAGPVGPQGGDVLAKSPSRIRRATVTSPPSSCPLPHGTPPTMLMSARWNWPGHEGQSVQVDVYSAAESVELFLNGRSLGSKPTTSAEKHMASFDVLYEPGELKAVGSMQDGSTVEAALFTTGAPSGLRLSADRPVLAVSKNSLCYVTVEVIDDQGRMDTTAETVVHFTVEGPGELYAVGSGNPTTTESYRGSQRAAFRGRCVAVVKSNGQPGDLRLTASVEGLPPAEVVITVA